MTTFEYALPDVGEGLSEAEIVAWRVAPGDRVEADQIIVEVETDKSLVEIPAPRRAVVQRLGAEAGDVVPTGGLLAVFEEEAGAEGGARPAEGRDREEDEAADDAPRREGGEATAAPEARRRGDGDPTAAGDGHRRTGRRVLASPATRRLAVERGVDLGAVEGSGPRGRVLREDVERAAAGSAPPEEQSAAGRPPRPAPAAPRRPREAARGEDLEVVPLRGVRRRIAQTMAGTLAIPAITDWRELDATELLAIHRRLRDHLDGDGVRLTLLPLVLKAVVAALRRHASFNARIDVEREEITYFHRYHIGVATATPDGLVVPVVRDADSRSLPELVEEIDRLAARARERTLDRDETTDGTFTISNYGSFGTRVGVPLIRPPEVAILGMGRVHDAVVALDGRPAVRPVLPLALSTDHRLNDGDHLAAFADTLGAYLTDPALLLASP